VTRFDTKQVEVYDSSTFKLLRLIKLPDDAGNLHEGLVVCSVNDCLYVSDWAYNEVYKVNLSASDSSTTTKWSVAGGPAGLSVNKSHNLLVACFGPDKVQEYTSTGKLVREIDNVVGVRHAVELNDGTLVVSQARDEVNCVSILSLDGTVLRRYPPVAATTSGTKHMKDPRTMAADKNGFILVADRDNNIILVLNPELTDTRTLPLIFDTPFMKPSCLWFEESRGLLYVGEDGGQHRVLAFKNVFNVYSLFRQ
jgi:DNA-binding beta-propeller fold protein YncE